MKSKTRYYLASILLECDPETHLTDDLNVSFEDEPGVLGSIVTNIVPVIGVTAGQKEALAKDFVDRKLTPILEGGSNA